MLIIHGLYRFRPKRVEFRNDYCVRCKMPRRAVRIRTFNAWHIFWIPLLPLGFWKRWYCTACRKPPHEFPGTRRAFKWIGLFLLLIFTALFWLMPSDPEFPAWVMWLLRFVTPIGAVLTVLHLMKSPKDPRLQDELAKVPPAADTTCPFCGTQLLMLASQTSCPNCHVVRV